MASLKQKSRATSHPELPVAALVGRQNVGKSTLFNQLIGRRLAIVADTPGVTRDRIVAYCRKAVSPFLAMDLGGWIGDKKGLSELDAQVRSQILKAFETADFFIFVVDGKAGLMPDDFIIAQLLRKTKKPVIPVVNKLDGAEQFFQAAEFSKIGFPNFIPFSAIQRLNFNLLIDRIEEFLPPAYQRMDDESVRVAFTGRPNVGKSSLLNAILGETRAVVSEIPGTTRDSIDTPIVWEGNNLTLVDTAGLKKKKTSLSDIEYYSSTRTQQAIESSDIVILLLDAREGIVDGDKKIAQYALQNGCGLAVAVNKMDLIKAPTTDRFLKYLIKQAPFLSFCPVFFVSAATGEGVDQVLKIALDIYEKRKSPLSQEILENILFEAYSMFSMPSKGSLTGRIYAIKPSIQHKMHTIEFIVNDPKAFPSNYIRFIERQIRTAFDLDGLPIELTLTPKKSKATGKKTKT
jgi:GTPase